MEQRGSEFPHLKEEKASVYLHADDSMVVWYDRDQGQFFSNSLDWTSPEESRSLAPMEQKLFDALPPKKPVERNSLCAQLVITRDDLKTYLNNLRGALKEVLPGYEDLAFTRNGGNGIIGNQTRSRCILRSLTGEDATAAESLRYRIEEQQREKRFARAGEKTIASQARTHPNSPSTISPLHNDVSPQSGLADLSLGDFLSWAARNVDSSFGLYDRSKTLSVPESLKNMLPFAEGSTGKEYLLAKTYFGRDWLAERVNAWLDDENGGSLCSVYGGPGTGKSTFCVHWAESNERVAAAICLTHGRSNLAAAVTMLQSIAYQLACSLEDYGQEALAVLKRVPADSLSALDFLDRVIIAPLERISSKERESLCIVIDGLDECTTDDEHEAVDAVIELSMRLPSWLRLLVSARPESVIVHAISPGYEIEIGTGDDNIADIDAYLREQLLDLISDKTERERTVSIVKEACHGVFLFAEAAVQAGGLGGFDFLSDSSHPKTLDSIFVAWFNRIFPDSSDYRNHWRLPLGAIVASSEPLPEIELERLLGLCESDVHDMKRSMSSFFMLGKDIFGNPTIAISHQYYKDWLLSDKSGRFTVSKRDSLHVMAMSCYTIARDNPSSLTLYEVEHALSLLKEAELHHDSNALMNSDAFSDRLFDAGIELNNKGSYIRAKACFSSALDIRRNIYAHDSADSTLRKVGTAHNALGNLALEQGDLDAAESCFNTVLSITQQLAASSTSQALRDLAAAHACLGSLAYSQEHLLIAEEHFKTCLSIAEQLVEKDCSPESISHLAFALRKLGEIAITLEKYNEAQDYCEHCLTLLNNINSDDCIEARDCELASTLISLGDLALRRSNPTKAQEYYKSCLQLQSGSSGKSSAPLFSQQAVALSRLGDIASALRDYESAESYYARRVSVYETIASVDNNLKSQLNLSAALDTLGLMLNKRGNAADAAASCTRGFKILEHLAKHSDSRELIRGMSFSLMHLGDIARGQGDIDAAKRYYMRSLALRERLVAEIGSSRTIREVFSLFRRLDRLNEEHSTDVAINPKQPIDGLGHAYKYLDSVYGLIMLTKLKTTAMQHSSGTIETVWVRYDKGEIASAITGDEYQEELEVRIGEQMSAVLPEEKLSELDAISEASEATRWLEENQPNFRSIVQEVLDEMEKATVFSFDLPTSENDE